MRFLRSPTLFSRRFSVTFHRRRVISPSGSRVVCSLSHSNSEYESHGSFLRGVSELKKAVRECSAQLTQLYHAAVMNHVVPLCDSPSLFILESALSQPLQTTASSLCFPF